jgi:hypothetical protein
MIIEPALATEIMPLRIPAYRPTPREIDIVSLALMEEHGGDRCGAGHRPVLYRTTSSPISARSV